MAVTLAPLDARGADRDALVAFLSGNEFPFHGTPRPTRDEVEARIAAGAYDPPDRLAWWLVEPARGTVGVVVVSDLDDDGPLLDLRLAEAHRGAGLAAPALRAVADAVFGSRPRVQRLEGSTREDHVAMRRAFARAGFVQESHHRQACPGPDGTVHASTGYALLRSDWLTGTTTPVPPLEAAPTGTDLVPTLGLPLTTDRLLLRRPTPDDVDAVLAYRSLPDVARYLFQEPWTRAVAEERLAVWSTGRFAGTDDAVVLLVERRDVPGVLGEVVLISRGWATGQVEVGYAFHPAAHGRGYATEAARAAVDLAVGRLAAHRVFARLDERNTPSARVCERLGMRREARLVENDLLEGQWSTELVYAVLGREWSQRGA